MSSIPKKGGKLPFFGRKGRKKSECEAERHEDDHMLNSVGEESTPAQIVGLLRSSPERVRRADPRSKPSV